MWIDGLPFMYTNWAAGEPANDYAVLHKNTWKSTDSNTWKSVDKNIDAVRPSVCKRGVTTKTIYPSGSNDCHVSPWGAWSATPLPPSKCASTRTRSIIQQSNGNGQSCPDLMEMESCQHCEVTAFTEWSQCVNGYRSRSRGIQKPASGSGAPCSHLNQQEKCVDCTVTSWGSWSSCVNNEATRTRAINFRSLFNSNPCPALLETDYCQNCEVSPWSGRTKLSELMSTNSTSHFGKPYLVIDDQTLLPCASGSRQRERAILKVTNTRLL